MRPPLSPLPEELIASIVSFLPDADVLSIAGSCKTLRRIAFSPLALRDRCLKYRYWNEEHKIEEKKAKASTDDTDWEALFCHRLRVDGKTTHTLDLIINEPTCRIQRFSDFAEFDWCAKEALSQHAAVDDDEVDDYFARRYWASEGIRFVHRRRCLAIWKEVAAVPNSVPIEQAYAALDVFVSPSFTIEDLMQDLDKLAEDFLSSCTSFKELPAKEKGQKLVEWMRYQGFYGTPVDRYRALKNIFLGHTLRTIRTGLPLTLSVIFSALARRCGLKGHPCCYPSHVLAMLEDPTEPCGWIYFDPFTNSDPISRNVLEDSDPFSIFNSALHPASTPEVLLRAAQNIMESERQSMAERDNFNRGYPRIDSNDALYAALTVTLVLRPTYVTNNLAARLMHQIASHYPMDVRVLEEELCKKISDEDILNTLENVCNGIRAKDLLKNQVNLRDRQGREIKYRVGDVLKHKKYGYTGAILAWSDKCDMDQEWIRWNAVESTLKRGKEQPFYHVMVDADDVRYVAQENIEILTPETPPAGVLEKAGKYFRKFDTETGRFVSNIKQEYPDD